MPRVLCVWFPRWPVQRLRNERPELRRSELVFFDDQNQRLFVTVCSLKAEKLGVRIGQPLAEAKTLIRNALFLPANPAMDREALCQLALDGQRFSPLVGLEETDFPESLLFDVTGCTHLWAGEERFLQAVRDYWIDRTFQIQLALAGSVGAAWGLARALSGAVVPEGRETAALSDLPAELLRLPLSVLERLDLLGLRTIGDILRLPRETLAGRFGTILPLRLDQALAQRPESFVSERSREPLSVVWESETSLDDRLDVVIVCRQMLNDLLALADQSGAGLQELEGELKTEEDLVKLEIRLLKPSRDEPHLAQLMELQLERCEWSGGVVAIRWTIPRLGRFQEVERNWFADEVEIDASRQVVDLIERLSSRLGDDAVLRLEAAPDALPEYAVEVLPWTKVRPNHQNDFSMLLEQARCRPCRLLCVPQWIAVVSVVPDGPPIRMTWRNEDRLVVRSWGPERIATGWWREFDHQRDYYRVEWENGSHAWVFRDRRVGRWFLHGFFE